MIDRKFKFVAVNPCNQKVYTEENAVIFCAKDAAIDGYMEKCKELGAGTEHIESILLMKQRIEDYQENIEKKIPDTDLPCEIDRCIGGMV